MKCPQCGAEVAASDMFCGSCGNPVGFTTPPESSGPPPAGATPGGGAAPGATPSPVAATSAPAGMPPPMPPPMPPSMPPGQSGYGTYRFHDPVSGAPVAEWWQRAVALIIDGAVFWIPGWIFVLVVSTAVRTTQTNALGQTYRATSGALVALLYLFVFVGYCAYYIVLNGGDKGQTLGKMALGIATRDESGQGPIGYGRAAGRFFIVVLFDVLCVIPLLLDYLSPLWDRRRQAWHDKVARSLVINVR
jgi:uncharacterized RDD family membrane protein YckC